MRPEQRRSLPKRCVHAEPSVVPCAPGGPSTTQRDLASLRQDRRLLNVFTVDVEDWPIGVLGPGYLVGDRVLQNTLHVLRILRRHRVAATFFVLTKVAQRFPELVRRIHDEGHEVASHGHAHELLTRMSPRAFERDVCRSIDVLGGIIGARPVGYRAPAFSVVRSTRWAGPILARLGFVYDSSVFPIRHRRYGIPEAPRGIHRWPDCDLIECPPATWRVCGLNLPVAGGGYSRLLPGAAVRAAIRRLNRTGMPAILYLHPYELDVHGVQAHRAAGIRVSPICHATQAMFRNRVEARLDRLLNEFEFTTMGEAVGRAFSESASSLAADARLFAHS